MDDKRYESDPLEELLDEESSREFGEPIIRDHLHHYADESVEANLKNWTAEEFASVYVRFRPHLERHARRYLSNPVRAEEVVQDAFLYLMTTLPELDSELGVLKFLKWKIRLLSLDVIRSSEMTRESNIPEGFEVPSSDEDFSADIERAEDNAIIRLALAKLNPRQREALVASVYEEKSSEQIAEQLDLSPNAARQLIFRAKKAFRIALIGEAEIEGKSISQVLSVAAKKAALDARQNAMKIGVFIAVLAIGIGIGPSLFQSPASLVADEDSNIDSSSVTEPEVSSPNVSSSETPEDGPSNSSVPAEDDEALAAAPESGSEQASSAELEEADSEETSTISESDVNTPIDAPASVVGMSETSVSTILATNVTQAGYYTNSYSPKFGNLFRGISVEVFGGTGASAFLDLNPVSKSVDQVVFVMWIDGERYYGVSERTTSETLQNDDSYTVAVVAEDFYVVDETGKVFSESPIADSRAAVTLDLDTFGNPLNASLVIEQK